MTDDMNIALTGDRTKPKQIAMPANDKQGLAGEAYTYRTEISPTN
jgi:hypothetical protein